MPTEAQINANRLNAEFIDISIQHNRSNVFNAP